MKSLNQIQRLLKASATICLLALVFTPLQAQILDPVSWSFSVHNTEVEGELDLVFHAEVEPCWHIYSQFLDDPNGPLPTYFELEFPKGVQAIGAIEECEPIV